MKMKRILKRCTAILLLCVLFLLGACGNGSPNPGGDTDLVVETVLPEKTDYPQDYTVYPRASGETQRTIYWIDARKFSDYTYLFCALALQGLANRTDPSLYLVSDQIVQTAVPGFIASEFWLNALDESYLDENGDPLYQQQEITLEEAVLRFRDKIVPGVKYDDRIVD